MKGSIKTKLKKYRIIVVDKITGEMYIKKRKNESN